MATGKMVVAYSSTLPVYVDGRKVGSTNEQLGGIEAGLRTVAIGDTGASEWSGPVTVEPGATVMVEPGCERTGPCDEEISDLDVIDAELPPDLRDVPENEGCASRAIEPQGDSSYVLSLTADLAVRDKLPQTPLPVSKWARYGTYGPPATLFPKATVPAGIADPAQWSRDRVIEVARKYVGTPYQHKHIPQLGLDCSNFTSWVYNYGLGIKFTSSVTEQAQVAGRKLGSVEPLVRGDLLYFKDISGKIIHTGLYIDTRTMIDESSVNTGGVKIKAFRRTQSSFAFARRVI